MPDGESVDDASGLSAKKAARAARIEPNQSRAADDQRVPDTARASFWIQIETRSKDLVCQSGGLVEKQQCPVCVSDLVPEPLRETLISATGFGRATCLLVVRVAGASCIRP